MSPSPWDRDPFFQYPLTRISTSAGEINMPILYYDCSVVMALFMVDVDRAAPLVRDSGLKVVRVAGDKTLVGVAFYEYRQTAIAAYNEVGVAIAVAPADVRVPALPWRSYVRAPDHNPIGFHIVDLPVTTEAACAAGREVWGYPKFVTPIGFHRHGREFTGVVTDPDDRSELVRVAGRAGLGVRGPLLDLVLYSRHEGQLLRTVVQTRGGAVWCLPGSMRLQLSASSRHPMTQRLRQFGLDGARPISVSMSDRLQLRLNAGAPIPESI
jgi:hypothetical protein